MKYLKVAAVVALAALAFACAPKIPQADIDAATAAFNDAKTAQADVYAPDAFKTASAANDTLQADLTAKAYGKAKTDAKALLDASNTAKSGVDAGKAAMQTAVDGIVAAINADLPVVQKEIAKAARYGRKAKVDVKSLRALVAQAKTGLADIKTSYDAGNIGDADAKATALQATVEGARKQLEDAGYKA